jgi:hypothetical protein
LIYRSIKIYIPITESKAIGIITGPPFKVKSQSERPTGKAARVENILYLFLNDYVSLS